MKRRVLIFALACAALLCIGCGKEKGPSSPTSERGSGQELKLPDLPMVEPGDNDEQGTSGAGNDASPGTIIASDVDGLLYPVEETKIEGNKGEQWAPKEDIQAMESEMGRELYSPGKYKCQKDLKPGTYVFYGSQEELMCGYTIYDTGSQKKILWDSFYSQSIADIRDGETLQAIGCYFEPIENAGNTVDSAPKVVRDGIWLVGYQIPEGVYDVILNEEETTNQLLIFEDPAREKAKNIILCTANTSVYLENGDYVELAGVSIAKADANVGTNDNTDVN